MGLRFLKIAVLYLMIGASLGVVMGISGSFVLAPVHAHLLLLGWASLALAGVIYHLYPAAAATRLARIHFWLHNIGLPGFMLGLALMLTGTAGALPLVAAFACAVLAGLVVFGSNVLIHARAPAATAKAASDAAVAR